MISAAFSHATTSWNSAKPLTLVAMPRLTTALPLWVNRCSGSAVIRPRMRKWLIPYDRDFAGVSVTSLSTSAARSGFRAMDVSSCEVDRVAFGERRAQGRSGNPSPQATCLGGCSADRAVLECHESDQQLTDKGTPRGRAEVRPGGRGRRPAGATRGTTRRMPRGVQRAERSDANGQRLCALGGGKHEKRGRPIGGTGSGSC